LVVKDLSFSRTYKATTVSAVYEYEPFADAAAAVPEPMTAMGTMVAAGMGLLWKKRRTKR